MRTKIRGSRRTAAAAAVLLATILGAWGSTAQGRGILIAASGVETTTRLAVIEEIEVRSLLTSPVEIHVTARGYFPDTCTRIHRVVTRGPGNRTFEVTITVARPLDTPCAAMLVQFDETVSLETVRLPPGTYTVRVNGISGRFEL